MTLTIEMRAEMRKAAEEAGCEAWSVMSRYGLRMTEVGTGDQVACLAYTHQPVQTLGQPKGVEACPEGAARMAHIVAACPANVIALLDKCDALEKERNEASPDTDQAPGGVDG